MMVCGGGHRQTGSTTDQPPAGVPSPLSSSSSSSRWVILKIYLLLTCITLQYFLVDSHTTSNYGGDDHHDHDDDDHDGDDHDDHDDDGGGGGGGAVPHKLDSRPAKRCQFPHIVLLHIQGTSNVQCAGSLIDRRHVITAAHCLNHGPKRISAHFGSVSTTQMPIKIYVENYTIHEHFVRKRKYLLNDVAILKLTEAVNISDCIRPITLATSHQYYKGRCIVAGWGVKTYYGPLSTKLHYSPLPIVPLKYCKTLSPYLRDQHLCAGELLPNGKTTCKGDSGSPLMCFDPHKKERVLVGIVSYGWKCKTGLSVYARVSFFYHWILKHIL